METQCANCKKTINRIPCRIKQRNYCNGKCQMEYEYKNGIRDKNKIIEKAHQKVRDNSQKRFKEKPNRKLSKKGYWMIYVPMVGWRYEHLIVWANNYGPIPKGYSVHHINLDPQDNRIENLQMMPTKEHHKLHDRLRKRNTKGEYK